MNRTWCRVPVLRLAERAGLYAAAQQRVRLAGCVGSAAANAGAKITSVVAGMVAVPTRSMTWE
jgi:hypothetical protein